MQGVTVVIHLAAQLGSWKVSPAVYQETNVEGTRKLVEEAGDGLEHFVYISTAGVLGNLRYVPAGENHPCAPRTLYEQTKYQAERYVLGRVEGGFPATIIRPSHVFGPGDLHLLPLVKMLQKLRLFPLIDGGKALFQPIFSDDLARGIISCIEHPRPAIGGIYLMAGDDCVTFKELIKIIARLLSIKVSTFSLPYGLAMAGAEINELLAGLMGIEPVLSPFRVDFLGRHQAYEVARAKSEFGFLPLVNVEDGLQEAILWYRSRQLI
jgi:nucleoside-diphosphate-sugar epimerase